jgi:hypothetical protein
MSRTVSTVSAVFAVVLSAAAAGLIVSTSFAERVEARTPVAASKGDRLDVGQIGPACSRRAWPYYETRCLRDHSQNAGRARPVRLVTTDRLPS